MAPAARVAVEQFDASSTRPLFGFGDGWHEQEFNPRTGLRWRWLSQRGAVHVTPRRISAGGVVMRESASLGGVALRGGGWLSSIALRGGALLGSLVLRGGA